MLAGRGTWNVEVRSVDVKARGHRRVLLVLHFPVLWGRVRGAGRTPGGGGSSHTASRPSLGADLPSPPYHGPLTHPLPPPLHRHPWTLPLLRPCSPQRAGC